MRKILSFVLVLVMVLSVAVTAIAAPNTQTFNYGYSADNARDGEDQEFYGTTTTLLKALTASGIVKGDGVGTTPSANAKLTRWQLALIALRLKTFDLDDNNWANYVVDYGNEDVIYADTNEAYDKALGAILYVQANGIIKGYEEDGKIWFKPAQVVTYAEALAVFVRICGWDSVQMNSNWPYNYVAQAEKLGLTDGIKGVGLDDELTYATLVKLIYNALASDKYISAEYITDLIGILDKDSELYTKLNNLLIDLTAGQRTQEFDEFDAIEIISNLAAVTFGIGYIDENGDYVAMDDDNWGYTQNYTVLKNQTTIAGSISMRTGNNTDATKFDLEQIRPEYTDNDDYFYANDKYKWYATDGREDEYLFRDTRGNSSKIKSNWLSYSFYELDENGAIIPETRVPALTIEQCNNSENGSANAWYLQTNDKNFVMAWEPLKTTDYLTFVEVGTDKYLTGVDGDVVNAAIAKAIAAISAKDIDAMIDMEEIREVAKIYVMECYVCTGLNINANHPGVNAVLEKAFGKDSIYLLSDEEIAILSDDWVFSDGGAQVDPGFAPGTFDWNKENDGAYHLALAMLDASNTLSELGYTDCKTILDFTYQRTFDILYAEAVAEATMKAIQDTIADELEDYLAAIAPANLVRWTDAKVVGYVEHDAADELNVWGIKAVTVEDSKNILWIGAENAVGSFVREVTVVDGVTKTRDYAHELFVMEAFGGAGVNATALESDAEFLGEKTTKTYGAWAIDTDGNGKYDVVVYANFVE